MMYLLDALRSRVEPFLGWAMLVVLSQCSTSVITESTWLMLEDLLREPGWPRQHFGHHVGDCTPLGSMGVEHATVWARRPWQDIQDAFLTPGYDVIMPHFLEAPPACAFQGWRQILR